MAERGVAVTHSTIHRIRRWWVHCIRMSAYGSLGFTAVISLWQRGKGQKTLGQLLPIPVLVP